MTDPYQGINTTADGPTDGGKKLKQLGSCHVYALDVRERYKHTVNNQTMDWVDAWRWYQYRENQVVEMGAVLVYRSDGTLQWKVKVIWGKLRQTCLCS